MAIANNKRRQRASLPNTSFYGNLIIRLQFLLLKPGPYTAGLTN